MGSPDPIDKLLQLGTQLNANDRALLEYVRGVGDELIELAKRQEILRDNQDALANRVESLTRAMRQAGIVGSVRVEP